MSADQEGSTDIVACDRFQREIKRLRDENSRLRLVIERKERANRLLARMNENAMRLRAANDEEKRLQYRYNNLLLEHSPDIIIFCDENLRYVLGSRSAPPLRPDSRDRLFGRPLDQVFRDDVDAAWTRTLVERCRGVLASGRKIAYTSTLGIPPDCLHLQTGIAPAADPDGTRRGVIMTLVDVGALAARLARAEAAARASADFLANMSHELRTPMNAIVGISETLLHGAALTDDTSKHIGDIRTSATSLLAFINDIPDFSKLDAEKLGLCPVSFEPRLLIDNVCSLAMHLASKKGLSFHLETDAPLPETVFADDQRLRQVLVNLLDNAVKFTESGSVALRVSFADGRLRFSVSDTGVGIPPERQGELFESFRQVDASAQRGAAGAGLGLSISKDIVQLMGGDISFVSEPGQGSTFTFDIPVEVASAPARARSASGTRILYSADLRVLVVDDNEINLSVAVGLLKTLYGIDSDQASSGRDAIEMAAATRYDLIFMDHMMPEMDGVETAKRIRRLGGANARVPIIALTANAVSGAKEMLIESGLDDFLPKPLQKADLDTLLRRWLPNRGQPSQTPASAPVPAPASSAPAAAEAEPAATAFRDSVLARVAQLPGLSVEAGLAASAGRRDLYEQSLKLLGDKLPALADRILDLLRAGALGEMTIHVHGVKSSLTSVGAGELSSLARLLEDAGRNGDEAYCQAHTPDFVNQLRRLGDGLRDIFAAETAEAVPTEPGDTDKLMCELTELQRELATYDYDAITLRLTPLLDFDFGPAINPLLTMMKEKVDAFDYDGAAQFLSFHFPELH